MTEEIAALAASRMGGTPKVVSCQRILSGFANANYRLETSTAVFLLRHRIGQCESEVHYELEILDWLRSHRFPAPAVCQFGSGERSVSALDGSHLVLLEWMEGSEPVPSEAIVRAIAEGLGDLHCLPPPSGEWWFRENPVGESAVARLVGGAKVEAEEHSDLLAEEFGLLRGQLGNPLPRGLIHADLFPDNTLFRGNELVAMLDFEDACEDVLLFDVAMTIHGFCFPGEVWNPQLAQALVTAYCRRRELTEAERDAFPIYLRWCPLTLMGWHLQQLALRPDEGNARRAAELGRRIVTMRHAEWRPN